MTTLPLESADFLAPWRRQARCNNAPPDLFFPETEEDAATAKAICAQCPVLAECRSWILEHPENTGVWAGTTEQERAAAANPSDGTGAPEETRAPRSLYDALLLAAERPGQWARVARYRATSSAGSVASQLRSGKRRLPPGLWDLVAETSDDNGSDLYARLTPEEPEP